MIDQAGYKVVLEKYEQNLKFEQKQGLFRHNMHNKIAVELKRRKIKYQEEANRKTVLM